MAEIGDPCRTERCVGSVDKPLTGGSGSVTHDIWACSRCGAWSAVLSAHAGRTIPAQPRTGVCPSTGGDHRPTGNECDCCGAALFAPQGGDR